VAVVAEEAAARCPTSSRGASKSSRPEDHPECCGCDSDCGCGAPLLRLRVLSGLRTPGVSGG